MTRPDRTNDFGSGQIEWPSYIGHCPKQDVNGLNAAIAAVKDTSMTILNADMS